MNVDEIKAGLAELDVPIVPSADPYERLLRRRRRSQLHRAGVALSAVAALIAAIAVTPGLAQSMASPSASVSPSGDGTIPGAITTPWVQRLMDTPTAGSLAADPEFRTALLGQLAPADLGLPAEMSQRLLLFAGDVGNSRAVLVVFHDSTRQYAEWLVGTPGTTAAQFVRAAEANAPTASPSPGTRSPYDIIVLPGELRPFSVVAVNDPGIDRFLAVGMAPAGCQVATSPDQATPLWTDAPAGNVVTLSDPAAVTVRARVTCDGVVRQNAPITDNARLALYLSALNDQQLDAALVGVRGDIAVDRATAASVMPATIGPGLDPDSCRVLYSGHLPGAPVSEPPVLFTACRATAGNTLFGVGPAAPRGPSPSGEPGERTVREGTDTTRFSEPTAVLAVRGVRQGPDVDQWVLVLGPTTATSLEVTRADGMVETVPLVGGVGAIQVPENQRVQLRALDATGAQVGAGAGPLGEGSSAGIPNELPTVDNWS